MQKSLESNFQIIVIFILVGLAALSRLIPHEPNFVPLAAIALFAGTYIKNKKFAIVFVLSVLLFSDIMLELVNGNGFYGSMIFVYTSIALIATIGFILRGKVKAQTILVSSLAGSILFFIITNLGVWMIDNMYPLTFEGLISCYTSAIPFFRGTLLGDLFYNMALFGSFALLQVKYPALVSEKG